MKIYFPANWSGYECVLWMSERRLTVYGGLIELDRGGYAWVELPAGSV